MKHPLSVTILVVSFFFLSQVAGMLLVLNSFNVEKIGGRPRAIYKETAIGERPEMHGFDAVVYIMLSIFFGTGLLLLAIRYRFYFAWTFFYMLAVFFSSLISLSVLLPTVVAFLVAAIFCIVKYRETNILGNVVDIFIFSGVVIIFAPMLEVFHALTLLLVISAYDFISVFKTKHMVKLAEFQLKTRLFAGIRFNYPAQARESATKVAVKKSRAKAESAIIGGGDVAFPLLFSATVINELVSMGLDKYVAFAFSLTIPVLCSLALLLLLFIAKKGKYYPAIPPLTFACMLSYFTIRLFTGIPAL